MLSCEVACSLPAREVGELLAAGRLHVLDLQVLLLLCLRLVQIVLAVHHHCVACRLQVGTGWYGG